MGSVVDVRGGDEDDILIFSGAMPPVELRHQCVTSVQIIDSHCQY